MPVGNRLNSIDSGTITTYTYDAANQLVTSEDLSGASTCNYDQAANLAKVTNPTGGITTNVWDDENR